MSNRSEPEAISSSGDAGRRAAALNHLLGQIGLSKDEQTEWWNLVVHADLGGRTATQAWLAGDIQGVTSLVERWYAASTDAAARAATIPAFVAQMRQRLVTLNERARRDGPLHRTA
jgi:hypothetical protein